MCFLQSRRSLLSSCTETSWKCRKANTLMYPCITKPKLFVIMCYSRPLLFLCFSPPFYLSLVNDHKFSLENFFPIFNLFSWSGTISRGKCESQICPMRANETHFQMFVCLFVHLFVVTVSKDWNRQELKWGAGLAANEIN